MARLKGPEFTALKEAINDGFSTVDDLQELASRMGHTLDELGIGPNISAIIRRVIGWAQREDRVGELIREACSLSPGSHLLANIRQKLQQVIDIEEMDQYEVLVLQNGSVLVDREALRSALRTLDQGRTIVVVHGKQRSGKSYSIQLIRHLKETLAGFEWSHVDLEHLPQTVGSAITAQTIGESIALQMGFRGMPRPKGETDAAWVERYCSWLTGKLQGKQTPCWIVIDSFQKVLLEPAAQDLVVKIAQRISTNLSQLRLVLLDYQRVDVLESVLSNRRQLEREHIKDIDKEILGDFFVELYDRRKMRRNVSYTRNDVIDSVKTVWGKVRHDQDDWLEALSDAIAEEAGKLV